MSQENNEKSFLNEFLQSLENLKEFNTKLNNAMEADKKDKESFLQYVNGELAKINSKISSLTNLINNLNLELNTLRQASNQNTTLIQKNDNEIERYTPFLSGFIDVICDIAKGSDSIHINDVKKCFLSCVK